jgi:alpha-mannosidase
MMFQRMLLLIFLFSSMSSLAETKPRLYLVPYSHLDTQWLWTYEDTISKFLKSTVDDNLKLMEEFPEYQFNFTGAFRYKLIKDYWPARYQMVKQKIKEGRWHVAGSMWEESDVLIPDPESVLRQVLYGNLFFEEEFGKTSVDLMLPDSFGFPSSLPTLIKHAGLRGFSSQKLTWGAADGVPFNVGLWAGPDGSEVFAALNPGPYDSPVPLDIVSNKAWIDRLTSNPKVGTQALDFRYFGVGDSGGAPRRDDVQRAALALRNSKLSYELVMGASDQIFRDSEGKDLTLLPKTSGEKLLIEHSAGTLSSNSQIKVQNRQAENLAYQAEFLASFANVYGHPYPKAKLRRAWETLLAVQMHDIMGGTAWPKANSHALNDLAVAKNLFRTSLESSAAALASRLDSSSPGLPLLLVNSSEESHQEVVSISLPIESGRFTHVRAPNGDERPLQRVHAAEGFQDFLFGADLSGTEAGIFTLFAKKGEELETLQTLPVSEVSIESDVLKVSIGKGGDILSIWNKELNREELKKPLRYEFLDEYPTKYPAWNMTWKDRKRPPRAYLEGPAKIQIIDRGFWRSAVRIERESQGSKFVQTISLNRGRPVVDITEDIDWRTRNSSFKASVSPMFSSSKAFYDMGLAVEERPSNSPKLFEMPQHEWMAMQSPERGMGLINSCCYGTDRPNDGTMRLTLLYTPHSRIPEYDYNATQDFGRHRLRWGIHPYTGPWQQSDLPNLARQSNQPILIFRVLDPKTGPLGRSTRLLTVEGASLKAVKQEERGQRIILRVAERKGAKSKFSLELPKSILKLTAVNAQEGPIEDMPLEDKSVKGVIEGFGLRSFALGFEDSAISGRADHSLALPFNVKAWSNADRTVAARGDFEKLSFPIEDYPEVISDGDVTFKLGPRQKDSLDTLSAQGQTLNLPAAGKYLHILAFGKQDKTSSIKIDGKSFSLNLVRWHGAIADSDRRILDKDHKILGLERAFLKTAKIAAYSNRSHGLRGNLPYYPNYLFHYVLPAGKRIELPNDPDLFIVAITSSDLDRTEAASTGDL